MQCPAENHPKVVMEHNKIVEQKPARDTERYKIKTTTVMTQQPHCSLCRFSAQYKYMSTKSPCIGLLLKIMICQSQWVEEVYRQYFEMRRVVLVVQGNA